MKGTVKTMSEPAKEVRWSDDEPRFVEMPRPPEGFSPDERTRWWYDTHRPIADKEQPYIAVQVHADDDPNGFVQIKDMRLLFTDQLEYYAVCPGCYYIHSRGQWSGSTRGPHDWREQAAKFLEEHQQVKGWCQFCDPVFGNGGWRLDS
jgi:hypothetical protein